MTIKKLIVNDESVGSIETDDNNIITNIFIHKTIDESVASQIDVIGNEDDSSDDYYRVTI